MRPLPDEHNSPKACNHAHSRPTLRNGVHGISLPGHPVGFRPHINPGRSEMQLLSLRLARPTGATLLGLAPILTTGCTGHLFALPLHDSLRHRVRGANQRHSSKREPTRQACVTTAVVASPVTMLANGHKAPLFSRPLQPDAFVLKVGERVRHDKLLVVVRDHRSLQCSPPVHAQ
jgi:hypothetical protein